MHGAGRPCSAFKLMTLPRPLLPALAVCSWQRRRPACCAMAAAQQPAAVLDAVALERFTAWVVAGSPSLPTLLTPVLSPESR